ncbi:MAG: hypothetical protein JNK72_09435 [Myxococcales bacterium]|nr:hypothetical protein [Myxococcales bacterium]
MAPPPVPTPATGDLGLRPKKKTKRGAPPMLPRRLNRRPPPPVGPGGSTPPPPPKPTVPGSLHTPARAPEGAEQLKQQIIAVKNDLMKLKAMKRTLQKQFWEVGLLLARMADPTLYRAVGYGTWESFVEREIEREIGIGRQLADELRRIVRVFNRETTEEFGVEKLRSALKVLYPEPGTGAASGPISGA